LAIGKRGQNVRLAAKLTGWKLDVTSNEPEPVAEEATEEVISEESPVVEEVTPTEEATEAVAE
jgi:transcription antitermination factor NusA-like protein